MFLQLLQLQWRKAVRSVSLGRSIISKLVLAFVGVIILGYLLLLGILLPYILQEGLGIENTVYFVNAHLFFFFLFEIMYRFMLQKLPVIELEKFLQLPIRKSTIIHYLLGRSFISPFNIIALFLFTPFALMEVGAAYGAGTALIWLGTLVLISWTLHWVMLWFKQQYGNKIIGLVIIFVLLAGGVASAFYGLFNLGVMLQPVFAASLNNILPLLVMAVLFAAAYYSAFSYYKDNAYVEDLSDEDELQFANRSLGFFSRFGLAGEMADLELKLILRHKKSRTYLFLGGLLLLYGLLIYGSDVYASKTGFSFFYIFAGIFVMGSFMMQYGQLFLSWNSSFFDFYLSQYKGARQLIKGKYLLFIAVSTLCFLLTVPYVLYGWKFLFLHLAAFLFNIGINIHVLVFIALWKPKPMDLDKGAMFNYEGVGAAQFLMMIPMIALPYLVYIPFMLIWNWQAGLVALGAAGILGIIFYRKLTDLAVQRLLNHKYQISASFRGEV